MTLARAGKALYDALSSYALACTLLLFLFLLTLLGTLEQVDHGLFEVQKKYFESVFLVHELGGVVPIPLPGVYLLLILLTINLVLGGLVRIRKSEATVGVIVVHVGILILMAAGLVKLELSDDGNLQLAQAGRVQELEEYVRRTFGAEERYVSDDDEFTSYYEWEVVVWDAAQQREVSEFIVGEEELRDLTGETTRTFTAPSLPFRLTLSHFTRNARPLPKGPMWSSPFPVIDGWALRPLELDKEAERNLPGLYVKAEAEGTPPSEGILWGFQRHPFTFQAGGGTYAVHLRKRRFPMPFTIRLDRFHWEFYPGTNIPKTYESYVTRIQDGVETPVKISMNEPLRHDGYVLFQASYGPGQDVPPGAPAFSVFAVVRNPSDQWPLIGCVVIACGLLLTFGQRLARYVRGQRRRLAQEAAAAQAEAAAPAQAEPEARQAPAAEVPQAAQGDDGGAGSPPTQSPEAAEPAAQEERA